MAEKLGTFPVPAAASPIAGLELAQTNAFAVPANDMALVNDPPQILTLLRFVTVGTWLTEIVKVCVGPAQTLEPKV